MGMPLAESLGYREVHVLQRVLQKRECMPILSITNHVMHLISNGWLIKATEIIYKVYISCIC
jgi:hypothetical protein